MLAAIVENHHEAIRKNTISSAIPKGKAAQQLIILCRHLDRPPAKRVGIFIGGTLLDSWAILQDLSPALARGFA
jgi:hypothetical protein